MTFFRSINGKHDGVPMLEEEVKEDEKVRSKGKVVDKVV